MDETTHKSVAVTTTDNPFDPFDNFEDWMNYDIVNGYYTCEKLDRLSIVSKELSDGENLESIEEAINELIKIGAYNKMGDHVEYIKVYK